MLAHIPMRQKIIVMLAVMSGMFLAALDQTIIATALPRIVQEFNGLAQLSWVVTAYMLTSTVTVPISGKLSDMYGRRLLILVGIVTFVVASLLSGISQNMVQLIFFRALQGMGAGILMSNAFAVIGDLFTPAERAKWQGIIAAVFGIASIIGPLLGGWLTDAHNLVGFSTSWRWTFFINIPVGFIAFVLIAKFLPKIQRTKERVDYLGAALLAGTLASFTLLCVLGGNEFGWLSWQSMGLVASIVAFLAGFIFAEHRSHNPLLPLQFFANPIFRVAAPIVFLTGVAMFGSILYIPLFKQLVQGASATASGMVLFPMVVALGVVSVLSGIFITKTKKYKILTVLGMGILSLGLLLLSRLTAESSNAELVIFMVITGAGLGVAMPVFNLVVQNAFPQQQLGIATASVQMFRGIGATAGTAVLGGVLNNSLNHQLGNLQDDPFVRIASQSDHGGQLSNLNVNTVQAILSHDGQIRILTELGNLPGQMQQVAMHAFTDFSHKLQTALSISITKVFLAGAIVALLAFIISFALKEIPLRDTNDTPPPTSA